MIAIDITRKDFSLKDRVGNSPVIADFKLSVGAGEFVCLVGPSGCGKTTLLNTISGLDPDYEGKIDFEKGAELPKIGYVFQQPRLLPWRTVRENIELAALGLASVDTIDFLLDAMQLTHCQHVYPQRLSLGMSRRVSIIRAFAVSPDLLLMDEPFVSLDAVNAAQVRNLLGLLWQRRPHTVLFVTHDLREAITLADRIIFLSTAPMAIIKEIDVPLVRAERNDEGAIETFRQQILADFPEFMPLSLTRGAA